jgi:LacI family transcriptional regulator
LFWSVSIKAEKLVKPVLDRSKRDGRASCSVYDPQWQTGRGRCRLTMTEVGVERGATLSDVAAYANVSRATVSLVLRQSPLVASATREKVVEAFSAVGYVYNRGAARLRTGLSGTIGVIVPEITNPFYAELTAGIDEVLDAAGRLAFLANSNESFQRQERFVRRIKEQGVDRVLLCAAVGTTPALVAQLRAWKLPCVQILRTVPGAESDFVGPDFREGTAAVIRHLVRLGHRRIALLPSSKATSASRDRIEAFLSAVDHHGLEPGPIRACASPEAVPAEVGRLLDEPPPATAFVCHNDLMALAAVGELLRRGLRPGPSLSVIGFDDIPEAAHSRPGLSTVATRPNQVGREAASLLLRRIGAPRWAHEKLLIAPRLIIRET